MQFSTYWTCTQLTRRVAQPCGSNGRLNGGGGVLSAVQSLRCRSHPSERAPSVLTDRHMLKRSIRVISWIPFLLFERGNCFGIITNWNQCKERQVSPREQIICSNTCRQRDSSKSGFSAKSPHFPTKCWIFPLTIKEAERALFIRIQFRRGRPRYHGRPCAFFFGPHVVTV